MRTGRAHGFSLVETVVALGIFAFCIVVLLGLLGVGLRSARGVGQENASNMLAESIFGAWQAQRNKSLPLTIPGVVTNLSHLGGGGGQELFFDGDGRQVGSAQDAALRMRYRSLPAAGGAGAELNLTFSWPVGATDLQTRTFSQYISF